MHFTGMERTFLGGPNKVKHLLKVLTEIELHTCVCVWVTFELGLFWSGGC